MAAALPGFAQDTSLLRYDGPDRAGKLVAAAQKEGWFALYTSFAEKDLPPLFVLFEKKYGVKVKVWRRSAARADGLPLHAGSRQAQGGGDRLVRARPGRRA